MAAERNPTKENQRSTDVLPTNSTTATTNTTTTAHHRHHRHKKKIAMCAIASNEELYIDEWVDYHHALGVDAFYIYDNTEGFELKQWGTLKGDHIKLYHGPGHRVQSHAYLDCHRQVVESGEFEWVAFFDVDEFLVLKKHNYLADMLDVYCPKGMLGVNWLWFGPAEWNLYAPEPVTRRFLYRKVGVDNHIKTIARVADIRRLNWHGSPHNFLELRDFGKMHDTNFRTFDGPFNPGGPTDVVVLHHYHSKSYKEQVAKRSRGRASSRTKPHWVPDAKRLLATALREDRLPLNLDGSLLAKAADGGHHEYVFDDSAWQFLKENVPAYARFDEIGLVSEVAAEAAQNYHHNANGGGAARRYFGSRWFGSVF